MSYKTSFGPTQHRDERGMPTKQEAVRACTYDLVEGLSLVHLFEAHH